MQIDDPEDLTEEESKVAEEVSLYSDALMQSHQKMTC